MSTELFCFSSSALILVKKQCGWYNTCQSTSSLCTNGTGYNTAQADEKRFDVIVIHSTSTTQTQNKDLADTRYCRVMVVASGK